MNSHALLYNEAWRANPDWKNPGTKRREIVFGYAGRLGRISPRLLDTWIVILKRVPHAKLWLLKHPASAAIRIQHRLQEADIDSSRLLLNEVIPDKGDHLKRMVAIDIALDTLEYNGQIYHWSRWRAPHGLLESRPHSCAQRTHAKPSHSPWRRMLKLQSDWLMTRSKEKRSATGCGNDRNFHYLTPPDGLLTSRLVYATSTADTEQASCQNLGRSPACPHSFARTLLLQTLNNNQHEPSVKKQHRTWRLQTESGYGSIIQQRAPRAERTTERSEKCGRPQQPQAGLEHPHGSSLSLTQC